MVATVLYVTFPGTAREALGLYAEVFGGDLQLNTFGEFSRDDGPADAIAHGALDGGPVALYGCDAGIGEPAVHIEGVMLSLLGTAEPAVLHRWFDRLAEGGTVLDPLAPKPWGAADGQVQLREAEVLVHGWDVVAEAAAVALAEAVPAADRVVGRTCPRLDRAVPLLRLDDCIGPARCGGCACGSRRRRCSSPS